MYRMVSIAMALAACLDAASAQPPIQGHALEIAQGMEGRVPDPIEGLWQLSSEESVLGIRATSRGNYEIVAIDSPSPGLLPGTVIGTARASAKYGVYDASIYTELGADGGLSKGKDFIVELTDGGDTFTLSHYYRGITIRPWRLLPYLYRGAVGTRDERPRDIEGCHRLYPKPSLPKESAAL